MDVRLHRLEREELARRHLLQRGRVEDVVHPAGGAVHAVVVADVADVEAHPGVVSAARISCCLSSSRLRIRTSSTSVWSRRRTMVEPKDPVPPVTKDGA